MLSNRKASEIQTIWINYSRHKLLDDRKQLIEHYLPLIKIVAHRLSIGLPAHIDTEDFISDGYMGLLQAIERFEPERGINFETYAVVRIRGSILDSLRKNDWVPNSIRNKAKSYKNTIAQLENELGRSATDQEIAHKLSLTNEQFQTLLNQLQSTTVIPLDEFVLSPALPGNYNPVSLLEDKDLKDTLAKAIDRLPEKERLVISLYYYEGLTLKEISQIMHLTEARISQLHTKAVFRLRGGLSRMKYSIL